ncbi:hypothetical protein OHC33_005340 [Knufia fluminis]|uniref:Uncharacterized protein n=2 Tax=Knufia TaxID=430999 RepID=A0AAN8F8Q1_9EURO|nr:hypothetical protein OHC33_005340 [Knufia fluminis]
MIDHIRFINFPTVYDGKASSLVRLAWPDGIQWFGWYNLAYEFQLRGKPWKDDERGNVKTHKFIRVLLQGLHDLGWVYDASVTVGAKLSQKDTLVFRKHDETMPPIRFFTISFDQMDRITVHDAPAGVSQQLIHCFKVAGWSKESAYVEDKMEIRLKKSYLLADGEKAVEVRLMLLAIVETLEQSGYRIYASLKVVNAESGVPDSLVCCRTKIAEDAGTVGGDMS